MPSSKRYQRQMIIPSFGEGGQQSLSNARVLVVGCGGLGGIIAMNLNAMGIGTLGVIDGDKIEESNLHRQVFFNSNEIGINKAQQLTVRLKSQNPFNTINSYTFNLSKENAVEIFNNYDIIVDGTDNFPTRYLINDLCTVMKKPLVFGAIYRMEGQVAIFNVGQNATNYRDIFPEMPDPIKSPNCNEAGVMGSLPNIIGSMQAMEVVKLLSGIGSPLVDKVFTFDASTMQSSTISIRHHYDNSKIDIENTDYNYFCESEKEYMKSIDVKELAKWKAEGKDFQLIDVREVQEYNEVNMGAELMPLSEFANHINKISEHKDVVIHCRSGARSANAIHHLQQVHGFDNLYNLEGGILAWLDSKN